MDTYSLEAEDFIQEVSKHPAIWDLSREDNKCVLSKERAWADVARSFINNFDGMTESKKMEVFRKLNSKWRNLRDNYVRSLRRKNSGQRAYVYAKYFSFLDPVYLNRPSRKDKGNSRLTESNHESGSNDDNDVVLEVSGNSDSSRKKISAVNIKEESSSDEEPSVIENFKRRRRERSPEFLELKNEAEIEVPASSEPDEDKLFFDSLLPVVRQFDLDEKLELRTRILQLIKKIRSGTIAFNNVFE